MLPSVYKDWYFYNGPLEGLTKKLTNVITAYAGFLTVIIYLKWVYLTVTWYV